MMPIGYEPDLYVDVATEDNPDKRRGTAEDYKNMIRNFDRIFKEKGADNVIWVMDYSWNIRDTPDLAVGLWPQDVEIGWLFFNMFQFVKISNQNGKGDCLGGFDRIYRQFTEKIAEVPAWGDIPWGLGAWGVVKS